MNQSFKTDIENYLLGQINLAMQEMETRIQQQQTDLQTQIRANAWPKIKGKLTRFKCSIRGVYLSVHHDLSMQAFQLWWPISDLVPLPSLLN